MDLNPNLSPELKPDAKLDPKSDLRPDAEPITGLKTGPDADVSGDSSRRQRRRLALLSRFHIGLAVIGTLTAVAGIGIAIDGGFEFNRTKVFAGIAVVFVSTIFYITMIFVPDEEDEG